MNAVLKFAALERLQYRTLTGHDCTVSLTETTCGRVAARVFHPRWRPAFITVADDGFDFAIPPEWSEIEEEALKSALTASYQREVEFTLRGARNALASINTCESVRERARQTLAELA